MTPRERFLCLLVAGLAAVAGCGQREPSVPAPMPTFAIDADRITVSGISSGGYMAGQFHLAHSDLVGGVAMLGGGPFWCAEGSMSKALAECMKGGDAGLDRLAGYAEAAAGDGRIAALANLADDEVWIFRGALDDIMHPDTSATAAAFYRRYTPDEQVTLIDDVEAVHGFPTIASGAGCADFAAPYLNACDYDAAGELLRALYGDLDARVSPPGGELRQIPQPGGGDAEMLERAYLYVPESCANGAGCGVHVALHGCLQSAEFVDDAFARGAGYNEWADANDLLVLYPQVASSSVAPLNPNGCWDWWGYTGDDYATRRGAQISVIKATLDGLAGQSL